MPIKKLGQNFLLSQKAINQIIALANLQPTDIVLEVGAGKGALTEALARRAKYVIAVEKDERLTLILQERFETHKNVEIIEGDIRDIISNFEFLISNDMQYKVVANLPYYLSSFIIRRFLEIEYKPKMMVLTLQKELAERICQKPGKMSLISVMVNFYGKPSLGPIIKKGAFYPKPKVDSRILIIKDVKRPEAIDEKSFFRVLKIGFSSKRKMLLGNLRSGLGLSRKKLQIIFKKIGISEKARAQELGVGEWKSLYLKIKQCYSLRRL